MSCTFGLLFADQFYPRGKIIGFGCILWATFTSLFACTSSMHVALPIVAVNGIGLALVIPNCQSLVADYYGSHTRGKAFGTLWLFISVGGMLGALYATNVGKMRTNQHCTDVIVSHISNNEPS